jgi:hypothetical protein
MPAPTTMLATPLPPPCRSGAPAIPLLLLPQALLRSDCCGEKLVKCCTVGMPWAKGLCAVVRHAMGSGQAALHGGMLLWPATGPQPEDTRSTQAACWAGVGTGNDT